MVGLFVLLFFATNLFFVNCLKCKNGSIAQGSLFTCASSKVVPAPFNMHIFIHKTKVRPWLIRSQLSTYYSDPSLLSKHVHLVRKRKEKSHSRRKECPGADLLGFEKASITKKANTRLP